jgi:hypothetical protein
MRMPWPKHDHPHPGRPQFFHHSQCTSQEPGVPDLLSLVKHSRRILPGNCREPNFCGNLIRELLTVAPCACCVNLYVCMYIVIIFGVFEYFLLYHPVSIFLSFPFLISNKSLEFYILKRYFCHTWWRRYRLAST